jgi:hypothetical protein
LQDDLFCRLAVTQGLLTPEQVAEALEIQRTLSRPQRIGKILVAQGYLSPIQVDRVLQAQSEERGRPPEPEGTARKRESEVPLFGRVVLEAKLASAGEVEECVQLQRELAANGEYVLLGELLVRKGYLARRDVAHVLERQASEGESSEVAIAETGAQDRTHAFGLLVQLKRLASTGKAAECLAIFQELREDHEYARVAERLVRKAFLQHAASRAGREGLIVKTCNGCETASAIGVGGGPCARCGAPLTA